MSLKFFIKNLDRGIMVVGLVYATFIASPTNLLAEDVDFISLDEFAFDAYRIANNRDPYYPYVDPGKDGEYWNKGAAVNFNVDMIKYGSYSFYWRNRVHGESTNVQFREVGWQFETGIEVKDYVEIYYEHHSRHLLDERSTYRFPLENFYGVRTVIYKRDR